MRYLPVFISILISGLLAGYIPACAQETEAPPYEATVKTDGVLVYSGPGKLHYPTEQLARGTTVEVYRHDPGGWCAIRPVVGSFSMVPVDAVESVDGRMGRVTREGAKAWVGTRLADAAEPMWQVKLKRGEEVEIQGQLDWETAVGESQPWYQISPPSGEFRWVHRSEVEYSQTLRQPIVEAPEPTKLPAAQTGTFAWERSDSMAVKTDSEKSETLASGPANQRRVPPTPSMSSARMDQQIASLNSGWRRARQPMRVENQTLPAQTMLANPATSGPPERFADSRFANIQSTPVMPSLKGSSSAGSSSNRGSNGPMMAEIGDLSQRLTDLELALTREMLNPPSNWQLVPLIQQTQVIYQGSADAIERSQAERLLNKLRNCQQLKFKVENSRAQPISSPRGLRSGKPVGNGIDLEVQMGTTYDAFGWLDKLVRDSGNSPSTFVIKDDSGKITHHVSPVPGLNLHRYLRQKVGVIGQRGYHQQLRLDHVTVERVVVLQKTP
ncbi:MAG: hypothetical protein VYE64_00735 [Planctomycetota bacterium]|nr:hypothetical protein [Planctomycetota bacterium]